MRLRVENLGPLREADLDLTHDLIVLTGPNNSGKTWLAWTVYALMRQRVTLSDALVREDMVEALLADRVANVEAARLREALPEAARRIAELQARQLADVFASPPGFFADTKLEWRVPPEIAANRIRTSLLAVRSGWDFRAKWVGDDHIQMSLNESKNSLDTSGSLRVEMLSRDVVRELVASAVDAFFLRTLRALRWATLFPAERLAVSLFARELAASRLELVDEALVAEAHGSDGLDVVRRAGRFPSPIRDSLSVANRLDVTSRRTTPFADLADALERELLGGAVRASAQGELQFSPASTALSLPVHMTASVVKSLASFTYYLRHLAQQGDFIIVDEPELNLHPGAQRAVARFLGRLVNRGFKVMISTHSDFVVRELGHLVMLAHAGDEGLALARELGVDEAALIAPERLGAWLFRDGTAEQIPVDGTGFGVRTIDDEIARMNVMSQQIYARLEG